MRMYQRFLLGCALCATLAVYAAETNSVSPAKPVVVPGSDTKPKSKATPDKKATASAKTKISNKSELFAKPESAVTKQNHTNVRGQASIASEIITHLQKGDFVIVL